MVRASAIFSSLEVGHIQFVVPLIIIFTQYDLLVGAKRSELREGGLKEKETPIHKSKQNADRDFQDNCIALLTRFLGSQAMPPYAKVSGTGSYFT